MAGRFFSVLVVAVLVAAMALMGCSNKLAATVNGREILIEDVDKQVEAMQGQHGGTGAGQGQDIDANFRKAILDQMIRNELILDYAEKKKIKVSKKELDEALKNIKASFPSTQVFLERLQELNMTEDDLVENLEQDMVMSKVNEQVYKGLKASDKESKDYYEANKDQFKDPEQVKLRQIVLDSKEKAEDVLEKLRGGDSFEETAKAESTDDVTKEQGGSLGLVTRDALGPDLGEAAFALDVGATSEVVESQGKFYVLLAEEKTAEKQRTYDEAEEQVKQVVLGEKQREKFEVFVKDLEGKAEIKRFI